MARESRGPVVVDGANHMSNVRSLLRLAWSWPRIRRELVGAPGYLHGGALWGDGVPEAKRGFEELIPRPKRSRERPDPPRQGRS